MREILFKGKRADDKKWIYGFLIMNKYTAKENDKLIYITKPNIIPIGDIGEADYDGDGNYYEYEVIPETVGQFIGLTDKNGKKVFEGDILSIAQIKDGIGGYISLPLKYPVNVVVKWDMCAWSWETLCKDKRYISFPNAWCHFECEVIGNIHDNPELLKGGTDNA